MKKYLRRLAVCVGLLSLVVTPVHADPPAHSQGKSQSKNAPGYDGSKASKKHKNGMSSQEVLSALVIAGVTQTYLRTLAVNQGLTGYKPLPPGIQKKLAQGKPLPPGIAKKHLPASLIAQLPKYRGYQWRVMGTDAVLVHVATQTITDIFSQVFQ